jgi:hypothetical protein
MRTYISYFAADAKRYFPTGFILVGKGGSCTASTAAHFTLLHASMSSNITSRWGSLRRLGIYAITRFCRIGGLRSTERHLHVFY